MSLRSLPKTTCQNHGSEALRLRPFGSQWERISRYFATDRKRSYSLLCYMLDAILYVVKNVVKTGAQWRMLPGELAQWWAACCYFRWWREEGRILQVLSITSRAARRRAGRSARRTKCADHGLPVSSFCTGRAEPVASTLSRR
ncbi:transposase [Salinibacter ruber]|uniref:transposase n=1 Tax=Salinibacter ruber TaxID=146919 RepID=UPI002169769C